MANDLVEYRANILATLKDTGTKYGTTEIDEAIRRILNEYSRVFPDITSYTHTVSTTGRTQNLTLTDLISIIKLVHPYNSALLDPDIYIRDDYRLIWKAGYPSLYFTNNPMPLVGDKVLIEYAKPQGIKDLDSITITTVRLDHKEILITGSAGICALNRSQSLNETWGGLPGQVPTLMQWGSVLYRQFSEFLKQIRQEQNLNIFTKSKWNLDKWDK